MPARSFGKKIAYAFFLFSLPCLLLSLLGFVYCLATKGFQDVWSASLMSMTLFFASVALVLYFISQPPKHELLPWDAPEPDKHG